MPNLTRRSRTVAVLGAALSTAAVGAMLTSAGASSHREAPMISEDPVADNTDVYAFVAPDAPDHVTIIVNSIPFQQPAGGPNFYNFGRDVLYEIEIDNNGDTFTDIEYEFRFRTVVKDDGTYLYNTGPVSVADGEYENLNVQQYFSVVEERDGYETVLAEDLLVPPNNVGPRSTPDYAQLAAAAVHEVALPDGGGTMKVFAGQRDEVFPVDLGSIFDLGGLRPLNPAHLVPLDAEEGVNGATGVNVHSIAIQVPKEHILREGEPVIGVHATNYRRQQRTLESGTGQAFTDGPWVQISRLGNPLVNEVVIPLADKDTFNFTEPEDDGMFLDYVQNPGIADLLPALYPGAFECYPTAPREDLVTIFLTGVPGLNQPADVVPSEMLRLNTSIDPTPFDQQDPMGLLAGQSDGFPNGRRLVDDVVDIELQAIAGATPLGACDGVAPNNLLGDGVVGNDLPYLDQFPYLPHPHPGYDNTSVGS